MYAMNQRAEADFFNQISSAEESEPVSAHRLVQMLMEGVLERLQRAKVSVLTGNGSAQAESLLQAIAIIGGLRGGLDLELGGEIARNLHDLYDYSERKLMESKISGDLAIIDEVTNLFTAVKQGWDAIA